MVDNVAITPGTGATVAADDITSVLYQRIKLIQGADGVNDGDTSDANPFPVKGTGIVHLTNTPTITAGAYTTGMVVGGKISLTGAARVNAGSGLIQSASVSVKTALTAPYDILIFDTDPTNSTFTDNAALAVDVLDLPSIIDVIQCNTLVSLGTPQMLKASNVALPFKLSAAATTLYAVIVIRGAQTFASTTAVVLNAGILRD